MAAEHDPVAAVVNAYLDYFEAGAIGSPPLLDHLPTGERREAQALIANLSGARQFDPTVAAPSLERLLHGTVFLAALPPDPQGHDDLELLRGRLEDLFPWEVDVRQEEVRIGAVGTNYVVTVRGQRLRAQLRADTRTPADLRSTEIIASVGAIFGQFHDTAGVVLIHRDRDFSSVIVDPFDPQQCIEVPTGNLVGARPRRPILPLTDAVRAYIEEITPPFAPIDLRTASSFRNDGIAAVDIDEIVNSQVNAVVQRGRRARTREKIVAWTGLDQRDINALSDLVRAAYGGDLGAGSVDRWLDERMPVRS